MNSAIIFEPYSFWCILLPRGLQLRGRTGGAQFWSGTENHCEIPNCESVEILVPLPLPVAVTDIDGT